MPWSTLPVAKKANQFHLRTLFRQCALPIVEWTDAARAHDGVSCAGDVGESGQAGTVGGGEAVQGDATDTNGSQGTSEDDDDDETALKATDDTSGGPRADFRDIIAATVQVCFCIATRAVRLHALWLSAIVFHNET